MAGDERTPCRGLAPRPTGGCGPLAAPGVGVRWVLPAQCRWLLQHAQPVWQQAVAGSSLAHGSPVGLLRKRLPGVLVLRWNWALRAGVL